MDAGSKYCLASCARTIDRLVLVSCLIRHNVQKQQSG